MSIDPGPAEEPHQWPYLPASSAVDNGGRAWPALLGRATECQRLDELLAAVRQGSSGSLVLRGEAGIGKSALLEYIAARAGGVRVLRARGVQFESELAYSALDELVRPLLGYLDELPKLQAHALRVALSLGQEGTVNRLTVYGATLSLLAASDQPVLCLIDDAQWIDRASAEALLFAARRLQADRIAVVFAARDVPGFVAPGLPELHLGGLDEATGSALAMAAGMSSQAAARLVAATAGNPLALIELPPTLTLRQRRGLAPLDEPLPSTSRVEAAFLSHAQSLPENAWRALVVCAVCDRCDQDVVARALRTGGLTLEALDPAVEAGLIMSHGGLLMFRHPLVRSAVLGAAGPGLRQQAHLTLADALTAADADRRAWHLAAAAVEPDESVATALAATAEHARRTGGMVAEARAFERAAQLTREPEPRCQRWLQAARAWLNAGESGYAETLFDEILATTADPELTCRVTGHKTYLALLRGDTTAVEETYLARAESYVAVDPAAAGNMMSAAANFYWARMDVGGLLRLARRVAELTAAAGTGPDWHKATIRLAAAEILAGVPAGGQRAHAAISACHTHPADGTAAELAEILSWIEQDESARELLEREIAQAREMGDVSLLAYALRRLALVDCRSGRLLAAEHAADEAVQITEHVGQPTQRARTLATLARVEALIGNEAECREHARQAMSLRPEGFHDIEAEIRYAVGLCALGMGRPADAVDELEQVDDIVRLGGVVEPGMLPVTADLAECYAHLSRLSSARLLLGRLEAAADLTGRIGAQAAAARCRGLIAPITSFEQEFDRALRLHGADGPPLDRARTLLCYGQRLRRAKRRREARERLQAARILFEVAGAGGWARQCRAELDATGQRGAATEPIATEPLQIRLTSQERRIAVAAGEGLTNREIAIRVFLSPKTVDYHLGKIYRKLGVRSRHELMRRLN